MIKDLTAGLLTGWNLMRWLRLALGIFIAVQAFQTHDALAGTLSALLLLQVVTNTGCCGPQGCAVPPAKGGNDKTEQVEFEEVVTDKEK